MSSENPKGRTGYVRLDAHEQARLRALIAELGENRVAVGFGGISPNTVCRAAAGCALQVSIAAIIRTGLHQ